MLTPNDTLFLRSLRIRPDDDIAPEPEPWVTPPTAQVRFGSSAMWGASADEQAYVEALRDPHAPRGAEGHPQIATSLYAVAHANLRAVAIKQRAEAYSAGERCKCGAVHPAACCYL
jgi:hypothetical protein